MENPRFALVQARWLKLLFCYLEEMFLPDSVSIVLNLKFEGKEVRPDHNVVRSGVQRVIHLKRKKIQRMPRKRKEKKECVYVCMYVYELLHGLTGRGDCGRGPEPILNRSAEQSQFSGHVTDIRTSLIGDCSANL